MSDLSTIPEDKSSTIPDDSSSIPDDISSNESEVDSRTNLTGQERQHSGARFWLVFLAICITLFLSALDYTVISTALPTIVYDLQGDDFVWVASAYALAATALLPASGAMAQVFGRRATILCAIGLFALGSAVCGSARSMKWLIAGRTVQGAGGGAIQSVTMIIVSDLVPLRERAMYNGLIGLTWAVAAALGPIVGGSLAQQGQWRWLFYLNLPLSGIAALLVLAFLKLKTPRGSFLSKIVRMDWIGNFLVVASSASVVVALTWGGVKYPWISAQVLGPLIVGLVGLGVFLVYEALYAKEPLVPFILLSNRTSLSGYLQTFLSPIILVSGVYFLPVYYQACGGATPLRSGVLGLGLAGSLGPLLIVSAATVALTKSYRALLVASWLCYIVAVVLLSTLSGDVDVAVGGYAVGYPVLLGVGAGISFATTYFPVLAPLPVEENARALACFAFLRSFASVWSFSIGIAILQTQLTARLPQEFVAQFPEGVAVAYSIIPVLGNVEEPLRGLVREAFAESLRVVWRVMVGVAGAGLVVSLFMKGLPLHTQVDERWGMERGERDAEEA